MPRDDDVSYLTQMAGLAVQNFVSAATGMAVAVALVRGFTRSEPQRHRQLLGRPRARRAVHPDPARARVIAVVLVARGGVMTFDGPAHVHDARGRRRRRSRAARPRARSRSSSSAPTAAASSTRTRPTRSSRHAVHRLPDIAVAAADPVLVPVPVRPHARPHEAGDRDPRRDADPASAAATRSRCGRDAHDARRSTAAGLVHAPNLEGKESGNTVAGGVDLLGLDDDDLDRRGELVARLVHRRRRRRRDDDDPARRGRARRRRLRALRDPDVRGASTVFIGGLMVGRTPEYLGKTIGAREVKLALIGTLVMPIGFLICGRRSPRCVHDGVDRAPERRAARVLRDPLRLRVAVEQQRVGVRRAHRRDPLLRLDRRRRDAARALRGDRARSWRSPARWRSSRRGRSARARCRPARRSSSACWSA